MKQLRLDFSDYSAREQERDAMKSCYKQIYLMRIDGKWTHYSIIDGKENYDSHDGELTETYHELKSQFPGFRMRVIRNEGIEDYLRDMLPKKRQAQKDIKQLKILGKNDRGMERY